MTTKPRGLITTDDIDMAQLMTWLADNQLPDGNTFLLPGSVGSTALGALPSFYGTWGSATVPGSIQHVAISQVAAQGGFGITGGADCHVPIGGIYSISLKMRLESSVASNWVLAGLVLNGADIGHGIAHGVTFNTIAFTIARRLNANDAIGVYTQTQAGGLVNPMGSTDGLYLSYLSA